MERRGGILQLSPGWGAGAVLQSNMARRPALLEMRPLPGPRRVQPTANHHSPGVNIHPLSTFLNKGDMGTKTIQKGLCETVLRHRFCLPQVNLRSEVKVNEKKKRYMCSDLKLSVPRDGIGCMK